jgi:hypothetical protein
MIKRLLIVFGQPETEDTGAYLTEVVRAIEGFSQPIQEDACSWIMKNHRSRRFPTPAECRKACEQVCEERGQAEQRKPAPTMLPEWKPEAVALADNLIRSKIGSRAANEGWVLGLHDFCRKRGRLPINNEISEIIFASKDFDEAYRECVTDPPMPGKDGRLRRLGGMAAALRSLGDKMLRRRDRCARVTDGEVLP